MNRPLVSVVIPTFNRKELLEKSIESVLAQTLNDFELFIVDDASTDGTAEWLMKNGNLDKRIHVIRLPVNCGCNAAVTWPSAERVGATSRSSTTTTFSSLSDLN